MKWSSSRYGFKFVPEVPNLSNKQKSELTQVFFNLNTLSGETFISSQDFLYQIEKLTFYKPVSLKLTNYQKGMLFFL